MVNPDSQVSSEPKGTILELNSNNLGNLMYAACNTPRKKFAIIFSCNSSYCDEYYDFLESIHKYSTVIFTDSSKIINDFTGKMIYPESTLEVNAITLANGSVIDTVLISRTHDISRLQHIESYDIILYKKCDLEDDSQELDRFLSEFKIL